jgi:uncharacterized protein
VQLHLEGAEDLDLERERVFELLTDSGFIAKALPDAQETRVIDVDNIEAKMKIGMSFLTTNMAVKLRLADRVPPSHARIYAEGSGSGSIMRITSDIDLEGDAATKLKWSADAEITGIMAGIGSSILKGFAEKKVTEIFAGIRDAMVRANKSPGHM